MLYIHEEEMALPAALKKDMISLMAVVMPIRQYGTDPDPKVPWRHNTQVTS
jgi:hypothetical protein